MRLAEGNKQFMIGVIWSVVVFVIFLVTLLVWEDKRAKSGGTPQIRIVPSGIVRSSKSSSSSLPTQYRSAVITLNQILIHSGTHEIAQSKNDMVAAVKRWVDSGAKEIFLIYTIFSHSQVDETKEKIKCVLKEHGIRVPDHRILFTSTEQGRASVARQISPAIFLEPKEELVTELVGKIEKPIHVKNVLSIEAPLELIE